MNAFEYKKAKEIADAAYEAWLKTAPKDAIRPACFGRNNRLLAKVNNHLEVEMYTPMSDLDPEEYVIIGKWLVEMFTPPPKQL